MKTKLNQLMQTIVSFVKSHVLVTVIAGVLVVVLVVGIALAAGLSSDNSSNTSSEDESGQISDETMVDIHLNMEEAASSQNESSSTPAASGTDESSSVQSSASAGSTSSKPSGSSKPNANKPAASSKPASSKANASTSSSNPTSTAKTIVDRVEGYNGLGLKYSYVIYSDGTASDRVVECEHCHQMPCPDGGGTNCSAYTAEKDSDITCQQCGKPYGDGHNGTCYGTIDWSNGGKVTCHHYD